MVGSAFYYIRDVFFKWKLYYEAALSSCILGVFCLAPFLLYTNFMPDNFRNVQVTAPSKYWRRKEIGLCLKANKPMLPPCTAVSEAIPG